MSSPPAQIEVTNPSDGGFFHWLFKLYAFAFLGAIAVALFGLVGVYIYFATTLPTLPDLATYHETAATTTMIRAWDGTPLGELAAERREILPFEKIPPMLVDAFLAAEDRRFYEHGGLDFRGIARALGANLRAGEVAQGGSTITQQVAKSFLGSERTIQRKIREAILARRLESRYSKRDILTLYLNQIFLGHGAYGVGAAARRYYDKAIDELDLGEMATLAGLARAPSRFSPLTSVDRARARRDQVLAAMVASGYISDDEANRWRARPVTVRQRPDYFHTESPYFTEHVRRDVAKRYGEKKLLEGGLQIETTLVPWIDAAAQENVDFSTRKLDKRQGWRGPVAHLVGAAAAEFRRRVVARYGAEPPAENHLYLGLVEGATTTGDAKVRVGENVYLLPSANFLWAWPYSAKDTTNGRQLETTVGVLRAGDVVWVANAHHTKVRRFSDWTYDDKSEVQWLPGYDEKAMKRPPPKVVTLTLEQTPRVQGTIFSYDHGSGYVVAMVGGDDFDHSEFNRVSQACRQPGSAYKPIYYSLALDRGYGFASLLNDVPRAEVDPITGEVWTPTNLNNTVEYQVTLEYALIWSKNVPSVQLFKLMGGHDVEAWARRLGFSTTIIPDQALALGASCTRTDELTRAFSAFARNGVLVDPVYIRRVRDRDGAVVEDHTSVGDPFGAPSERLDRLIATADVKSEPVISPHTAWLTSNLLRHVVTHGHAAALRIASLPAAGKTGTSSATMDTWFVGYTSRWMTTTWVGDDLRERSLGLKDAAFMITVPMFARYMTEVAAEQPLQDIPWERPPGVKAGDTGGKVRTTMEEVEEATEAEKLQAAKPGTKVTPRTPAPRPAAPAPPRPSKT
ncbi:MAG TPA: PBP1A family penicillin-binding protein [Polyangia bacterium]|jgi:penicillin-binding protein 1A|nr:PBP1A family penicillin-binding protein [Polyangia bacterium]